MSIALLAVAAALALIGVAYPHLHDTNQAAPLFPPTRPVPTAISTLPPIPPSPTPAPLLDLPLGSLSQPRPQAGMSIAVDPQDDRLVVAAANDYNSPRGITTYRSLDSGRTWTFSPLPAAFNERAGDPKLVFAAHHVVYLAATEYLFDAHNQAIRVAIVLFRSADDGRRWTWLGTPSGTPSPKHEIRDDWPGLAIDRDGTIYIAWTHFSRDPAAIRVAVSRDAGHHFAPLATLRTGWGVGASVGVDGHGAAYVAYEEDQHRFIAVARFDRHGHTLSRAAPVTPLEHLPGLQIRVSSYPQLAVDQARGKLYVTWDSWERDRAAVWLAESDDGGRHWGKAVRVPGDRSRDYFMPNLSVSPTGLLGLSFYGRIVEGHTSRYHTYLALPDRCGTRIAAPRQVDTIQSTVPGGTWFAYLGDVTGIALTRSSAHLAWTDLRGPVAVMYTRALPLPPPPAATTCPSG